MSGAARRPALPRVGLALALAAATIVLASARGDAQATLPTDFADALVVGGFATPTGFAFLPDGRALVTEQLTGKIRLIVNGALSSTDPVGTVPNVRTDNFFRGVLGIAVDPRWPASPYVYVHVCSNANHVLFSRFTVAGDLAFTGNGALTIDPATRYELTNDVFDAAHNGGSLRFGPDQMLYASVGDSFFTPCAAQRLASLRGVVLRMDVRALPAGGGGPPPIAAITPADNPFVASSDAHARLVWAYGFRNPFRFHIDPATGVVFVADVGEDTWEEIDRLAAGGGDYGWPLFEGPMPYTTCDGATGPDLAPIHAYGDGHSAISAGVYHRPTGPYSGFPPSYDGDYFFSDYYNGALRRLEGSGSSWAIAASVPGQPNATDWATGMDEVSDYALARDGSLWYCRQGVNFAANTGQIRRIAYTGTVDVAPGTPAVTAFAPPRPTPSHGVLALEYSLAAAARVTLSVHDLAGRRVRTIEPRQARGPGPHTAHWDGALDDGGRAAPGLYFVRLDTGAAVLVRRIVWIP